MTTTAAIHHAEAIRRLAPAILAEADGRVILLRAINGNGATYLARCMREALPELSREALLRQGLTYGAAHLSCGDTPPFRAPHSTTSTGAMLGVDRPGEIDLARHGILLLDGVHRFHAVMLDLVRDQLAAGDPVTVVAIAPPQVACAAGTCRPLRRGLLADAYEVDVAARVAAVRHGMEPPVTAPVDPAMAEADAEHAAELRASAERACKAELIDWVVEAEMRLATLLADTCADCGAPTTGSHPHTCA